MCLNISSKLKLPYINMYSRILFDRIIRNYRYKFITAFNIIVCILSSCK